MFLKIKLTEIFKNLQLRYFNSTSHAGRATKLVQFHSGGDDYCPPIEGEGLSENIGGNPADGVVFAWRDDVGRKAQRGEKRIYSIQIDSETQKAVLDESGSMIAAAEIHLKNDGSIIIAGGSDVNITVLGNANLSVANTLDIEAASITSAGDWIHTGNFTASHIEAQDGKDGILDKPSFTKGIATGGS